MQLVAIIDYGMGNLRSVAKALEHVDPKIRVRITHEADDIHKAARIVFPGQGAIGNAMSELQRLHLKELVAESMQRKPFLGICLGLQALMQFSEEDGGTQALGFLPGEVIRFPDPHQDPDTGERLKVPHMGWNQVHQARKHPIWQDVRDDSRFYFVHSYYVRMQDPAWVSGTCRYGLDFVAAAAHDNVFAAQFHPEKSAAAGLQLLANFLAWDGQA